MCVDSRLKIQFLSNAQYVQNFIFNFIESHFYYIGNFLLRDRINIGKVIILSFVFEFHVALKRAICACLVAGNTTIMSERDTAETW
jgi:hypothetical protein